MPEPRYQVSIWLDLPLYQKLEEVAKEQRTSRVAVIRVALAAHLDALLHCNKEAKS